MYTYPNSYLDSTDTTSTIIGSFFADTYGGADLIQTYLIQCDLVEQQNLQNLQETQDTLGRQTCPLFHLENWLPVTLNQANMSQMSTSDLGGVFYDISGIVNNLVNVAAITNGFTNPSVMLTNDIDFFIEPYDGSISFQDNPFLNPNIVQNPDGTITLWLFKAQLDLQYLQQHWGSVIGIQAKSTPQYKRMINAYLDAVTSGTSYDTLARFISAMTDIPIARTDGEIVTDVFTDPQNNNYVATNLNIYNCYGFTAIVTVGQVLSANDQLTDVLQIVEGNDQTTLASFSSITLGPDNLLLSDLTDSLTFENSLVALVVTLNVSGYTKLSWSLFGNPTDVTTFFNDLHTRGVANGATLANYMDQRPQPQPTQPGPGALPTQINPFLFVVQNVLRNNALLVQYSSTGPNSPLNDTDYTPLVRILMPPNSTALINQAA